MSERPWRTVSIVDYQNVAGSDFVLYNIFVDGLFHCARRYSAFIGLATALKALDPNHKFMKFPTRWTVSSTSLSVLNARKRLLSRWLEDVAAQPVFARSDAMRRFLQQDDEAKVGNDLAIILRIRLPDKSTVLEVAGRRTDKSPAVYELVCEQLELEKESQIMFALFAIEADGFERKLSAEESPVDHVLYRRKLSGDSRAGNVYLSFKKFIFTRFQEVFASSDQAAVEIMYKQARADITEGRVFATRKELALLDDVRLSEGPMPFLDLARRLPGYGQIEFPRCRCSVVPEWKKRVVVVISINGISINLDKSTSQTRKVFKFVCLKRWRYDDALPTPSASPQHSETSSVCSGSSSTAHSHPSVSGRPLGLFQFEYTDEKCHKDVWVTLETPYAEYMMDCVVRAVTEIGWNAESRQRRRESTATLNRAPSQTHSGTHRGRASTVTMSGVGEEDAPSRGVSDNSIMDIFMGKASSIAGSYLSVPDDSEASLCDTDGHGSDHVAAVAATRTVSSSSDLHASLADVLVVDDSVSCASDSLVGSPTALTPLWVSRSTSSSAVTRNGFQSRGATNSDARSFSSSSAIEMESLELIAMTTDASLPNSPASRRRRDMSAQRQASAASSSSYLSPSVSSTSVVPHRRSASPRSDSVSVVSQQSDSSGVPIEWSSQPIEDIV